MKVADILGPWYNVERTDEEGSPYRDRQRRPQFTHDISVSLDWTDVTAQLAEHIPPTPALCVWRVWCDEETLNKFSVHKVYVVRCSSEVKDSFQEPEDFPSLKPPGDCAEAFSPLPDKGELKQGEVYQYGKQAVVVKKTHFRTECPPEEEEEHFTICQEEADVGKEEVV